MLSAFLAAVRIVLCWLDVTHRRKTALASGICDSVGDTVLSKPVQNQCPCSVSGDNTPFAGPVIQMRCKTKVPDTCSHDRFHSKLERKVGDCPSILVGFTDKWMYWKTQDDRWAWLCLPGVCCTWLLCVRGSRRGVPQSHTWQQPCIIPLLPTLCGKTGSTMHPKRELRCFH